ncbi:hypothetical protein BLNAU_9739 [Blattamonas nauphoetae]|uniref:Uncharacterized protein n=1 Tax=Blattamonas nauphoetae TaxID=2049346 RepID=A0ABQ9XV34_9EUKA|nr:hypothetical protein BLNAU_9739 [Blattamonas nauphoetae]
MNSLFKLINASLSVADLAFDLHSESWNGDVTCASITSSSIHITNCGFLWTGLHSLFVLQESSLSPQTSSSITLIGCTLDPSEQRLAPIVEDLRGIGGSDLFSLDIVGIRIANTKVIGADGIGVAQPSQNGISSDFEGICTTFSEISFSNVSSLPGTVRPVSPMFSQRMVGCGIWGSNNHLSGSTVRDMNGGGGFVCSNSSFNWCHTTSSERPSLSPHTPTLSSSLASPNTPDSPAEEGDDEDDQFTGKIHDGVARFTFTEGAITFTRCWFFNMQFSTTNMTDIGSGGSALSFQSGTAALTLTSCKFENCSVSSTFAKQIIYAGCVYLYRAPADIATTAEATVDSCSFTNWSSPSNRPYQYGGCVGTMNSAHNLNILNSNMTQVMGTTKLNGGFISHNTFSEVALTIDKCQLSGDGNTIGHCVNLTSIKTAPVSFSMTDTEIDNTNSTISFLDFTTDDSIDFIRVNVKNASFFMHQVSAPHGPILFLDCVLDQTCRLPSTQSVSASFLYSGTTFTGAVTTNQGYHVNVASPVRHLIFQQCIFTECSTVANSLMNANSVSSLTLDSSSFTNCFGAHQYGLFSLGATHFRAHSCTFTNVYSSTANIVYGSTRQGLFFENCRFDFPASNRNDFLLSSVSQVEMLNESSIVGCTSNRPIAASTNFQIRTTIPFFKEVTSEPESNKMRVGTWPAEEGFSLHSTLTAALGTLTDESLLPNIVFLSEESHQQASNLDIKHDVEIVGTGSNTSNFHFTELTTAGFKPKVGGKLTLRSMKLIPSTLSTTLFEMDEDVNLLLTRTFVDGVSGQTVSLMLLSLGTTRIAHSAFQIIKSGQALISVSGSASLTVSDTYFIAITRTSLEPPSPEATQCASCVEGKTSGEVTILFSRFGVCTTNGRAGAIDLERAGESSSVEMEWNKFDQNKAGTDVDDAVKGDDVVLKDFSESQLTLNLATQQSFPTTHSFLINSTCPIIPPPGMFNLKFNGTGGPLAWADINIMNADFLSGAMTLQFLLGSLERADNVFCQIVNSTLTLKHLRLSFDNLETSAFVVDTLSSFTVETASLIATNPLLKAPVVFSEGKFLKIYSLTLPTNLILDDVSFVKAQNSQAESSFSYQSANPSLATLASLDTAPFISLEGVTAAEFYNLNSPGKLGTFLKVSLVKATNTNITFRYTQVSNLQTTANGLYLNADSCNVTVQDGTLRNISAGNGGFLYNNNSNITILNVKCTDCSATKGGIVYAENSNVSFVGAATYTSCIADEGGVAYLVSSTLQIAAATFTSNSAKRGCVAFVDLAGDRFVSTASSTFATFSDNTATDVVDGVDCGKGGVFFITGTTTATNPLNFGAHHFEGNKATFGNDVFVEESVLGSDGPTRLSNSGGESYSAFPHLEIENHNTAQDELSQISDFIPFPTLTITTNGTLTDSCKWSNGQCRTLIYALQYLQTTYPNGTLYPRSARQGNTSMTTEPIVFVKQDLWYSTGYPARYNLSLTATHDSLEETIFTIEDESRLKLERMNLILKSKHFAAKVTSEEGSLVMESTTVLCDATTTKTVSPIWSVGISVGLNNVTFHPSLKPSIATLSSPLVHFAPQPSEQDELGSGCFEMTNSIFSNLTFEGTTMIEVDTTVEVTFTTPKFTTIISDQNEGKYLRLKGRNFKTQLKPEPWDDNFKTPTHIASLWGEDISMDEKEKWKRGSLVYWLVSPSSEVVIGKDDDAVDHPNCGSSTFKCTTLDSAFSSAGRNSIDTISFSVSTTLSSSLSVDSSLTFKSFSNEKQTITFDDSSSMMINKSMQTLTLTSLVFTITESCSSATLFVVEKGEMKFSSCLIGSSDSSSPLVVPATTTKLIEVGEDGRLTLIDTLIHHISFTHATLGTALHLHADSTLSFTGSTVGEITSHGIGSHVVISSSTGLNSDSISSLASQIEPWGPSTTNGARFTQSEIDEFVVISSSGGVEELIYWWHPYDELTLFVDRSGGSHSKCGLSSLPCSSLSSNLAKLGTGQVIKVCDALDETASITTTRDLSILSSDTSKKEVHVSETCSFTSKDFTLSITSLSFVPLPQTSNQNTDTNTRSESLFIVESGSLSLTSCSVSSFELSSSPLITHTSGTLTLQSCSVSSITRSTGNGTVLSTEMETGKLLLLDEIEFWSMSSSKDSPILALSFPPFDESHPDPLFDFTLTNLSFTCMTGMETEPPCFISLVGHDLASWIEVGDDRFKHSYAKDSDSSDLWSVDEETDLSASLLFYLLPSSGPVGVSNSGYDMSKCGSNSLWCSTIELSLTRLSAQNTKKIVVIDEVTLSTSIALPDELTFAGNPTSLSTCVVSGSGSLVSEDIDFTTISKLTFCLPSTQTADAVIVHSSTRLTLLNLELTSTSESSARFLKVTAGKAEMSDIEVRSEMASSSILFWILGGTVTASQFHVKTGIAQNGAIVYVEGGSLSMTGMTATSSRPMEGRLILLNSATFNLSDIRLSKQSFKAPLFEFSSFKSSKIDRMTISECFGSTIVSVEDGDELTISNSEFSSIASVSTNGEDGSTLCGWETSFIQIENTPTSLSRSNLQNIPHGAISISNSPLTLTSCVFSNNSPSSSEWPSRRRNIKCTNGAVSITGIVGGDGLSTPHLWISTDECAVKRDDEIVQSPFFVPTLTNKSSSKLDKKKKEYTVTIVGTTMIPCGLSLEVFDQDPPSASNEAGQSLIFEISYLAPSKWTETELSFVLPQSSLTKLDENLDHRCRLLFGDGQTTDSFSLNGGGKGDVSEADLFVGKEGNDETGTGSDSMPYFTLSKCLDNPPDIETGQISVNVIDETRIGGCVVVGKETGAAQTIRISSTEWKGGKIVCEVEGGMFVVSDNAELSLAECWLTTREVVKTSFVEVGSAGSLTASDVSCSEGRFGGKGSVVVCVGSGRVEMREVEMTSCWFEGGGVVVGGSTRGILIGNSLFRNCSGGSFGSLIHISVLGCSAEVQNCVFEGCVTRLRMDEIADVGRAVGGGCVVIEMGHRRSSTRSAPHTSADLSMSSFVSCVLINTSPLASSPGNLNFVGGSGFLIFVSDTGNHVDLRKVRVVDSVCEKMEGWRKRGFEGGVVVWRGQSLRLDRREMEVKGSSVGLVKV